MSRALTGRGVVLVGLLAAACGGGGGGNEPPGPPTQLVKNGGDAQTWYFNNPLPVQLRVKALDANNRAVPGVVVTWAVTAGGGAVSPLQSTTDGSGFCSTNEMTRPTRPTLMTK